MMCEMLRCENRRDMTARRAVCREHAEDSDYMASARDVEMMRAVAADEVTRNLARAVAVLVASMAEEDRPEIRLKAAESILDRGGIVRGMSWRGEIAAVSQGAADTVLQRLQELGGIEYHET